jgi:predicted aspartyl protease
MQVKSSIRALPCLALALLSGAPAFAACTLTKVAEMPLEALGAHYAVPVQIGDVTRLMIVDTGAAFTALKSSVASELKLTPDPSLAQVRAAIGVGQTKAQVYPNVIPSVLAFGDLVYRDRSTVVSNVDDGNTPEKDSAGFLGDDILSQFDVEFDFPAKKLTFYRPSDCFETFTPWTGNYSSIPLVHKQEKIVIDVVLNEERTRAIVDTGASLSVVSRRSLALWGVSEAQLSDIVGHMGTPLNGGAAFPIKMYLFDKVKFGNDVFRRRLMNIADLDFIYGSALLGLDYWKTRKIWISYRNERMFLSGEKSVTTIAYPLAPPSIAEGNKKPAIEKDDKAAQVAPSDTAPADGAGAPGQSASPSVVAALRVEPVLHASVIKETAAWLAPVYSLGKDCEWQAPPTVSFSKPPDHGTASLEVRERHPEYAAGSPLEKCNALKIPMIVIKYTPAPGYVGEDAISVDAVDADGKHSVRQVAVTVD